MLRLTLASELAVFAMLVGCAKLWTPADTARVQADTAAQLACVDEAGTRAESRACRCAVMARYPEGPQCGADGGQP